MKLDLSNIKEISCIFSLLNDNSYLVGGFLRDYFLNKKSNDLDFVTDIKPEILKQILPYKTSFEKMGNFSFKYNDFDITVTTLRKEGKYLDYRHPSSIEFISSIEIDYLRRDFTINALYMDKDYNLIDPTLSSLLDLKSKTLKMIGDPFLRLKEDPLRIIRAYRFNKEYDLKIENTLNDALKLNLPLINKLNKRKVEEEINKSSYKEEIIKLLGEYYEH